MSVNIIQDNIGVLQCISDNFHTINLYLRDINISNYHIILHKFIKRLQFVLLPHHIGMDKHYPTHSTSTQITVKR